MTAASVRALHSRTRRGRARASRRCVASLERLEERNLLDRALAYPGYVVVHHKGARFDGSPSPYSVAFTPAGLRQAYGIDLLSGDGSGQTVAIIDAYDNPNLMSRSPTLPLSSDNAFLSSDLHQFDLEYGLPEPPGFFTKVDQTGGTTYLRTGPAGAGNSNWEAEEALDVEWVHALAPGAKIILVGTLTNNNNNLYTGVGGFGRAGRSNALRRQPALAQRRWPDLARTLQPLGERSVLRLRNQLLPKNRHLPASRRAVKMSNSMNQPIGLATRTPTWRPAPDAFWHRRKRQSQPAGYTRQFSSRVARSL